MTSCHHHHRTTPPHHAATIKSPPVADVYRRRHVHWPPTERHLPLCWFGVTSVATPPPSSACFGFALAATTAPRLTSSEACGRVVWDNCCTQTGTLYTYYGRVSSYFFCSTVQAIVQSSPIALPVLTPKDAAGHYKYFVKVGAWCRRLVNCCNLQPVRSAAVLSTSWRVLSSRLRVCVSVCGERDRSVRWGVTALAAAAHF